MQKIKKYKKGQDFVNKVILGDCMEIMKKFPDESFDMVFADPPYNMQLQNELYRPNKTKVDAVDDKWDKFSSFKDYDTFTKNWLKEVKRVMKPNASLWVIGTYHNIYRLGATLQDMGFWTLNDIVWVKANPMPNFRGVRFTNATESLIWSVKDKKAKKYTFNYTEMKTINHGKQMRSDWYFPLCNGSERLRDASGEKIHSTQKPLALLERIVLASTKKGDLILDPFGGTLTSGVAAHMHERNFTMIEKEEKYIDKSLIRFKTLEKNLF